ncbi:LolA-like protein [Actinokineospora iranica]|uniref:Lipoprotein LprG n=1 Tax=Actinokineospora iranica TaxID=1271860 RepID=A0A1G6T0N8_9PSEU|nr:hypothetical protein [Actinokineospora iranica]SDD21915.1 hypothetical protein SAMN05216174_108258 [Actinokineospora iranica]
MRFTGKTKLLVGVAAAALTLSACSGDPASTPSSTGGKSTEASAAAKTGFESLKMLSDAVGKKSESAKSAHMKFTGDMGGQSLTGEGDFSFGAETAMQMTMTMPGGEMTMLFVDNVIYFKSPRELEPGKPWVKMDLNGDNPMAKTVGGSLDSIKQVDPSKMLEQLADAGEITSTKEETIDGKETTHYSITVDVAKLGNQGLGMDKAAIAELEKSGVKTLPVEAWVDGDDLPVRFVTEVPAAGQKVKIQADYSDWGKTVDITAPPASQVAELPGS